MAAVTTAVVGTAVAIKGQRDAKKAQQSAAAQQEQAAIQSAQMIGEAGKAGERDILYAQKEAAKEIGLGAEEAAREIQPFAGAARGYDLASQRILQNQQLTGPFANLIRRATMSGVNTPLFADMGDPVRREMLRQAGINVSAAEPEITSAQLQQGTQGITALGDIAGIRKRGFESLADIAEGTGAARATALMGQIPELQKLASGATEARMIGDIAGQKARTGTIEELAKLAGRVI